MKVSVLRETLAEGLSIVSAGVAKRSTLPVLSNILVKTDGTQLKLATTNLEMGLSAWIAANVGEAGAVTVPAKTFCDLVAAFPNERVDMTLNERTHTLELRCGRMEANIRGIEAGEFPIIPTLFGDGGATTAVFDASKAMTVEVEALVTALGRVTFAAATDESRPILTGVLAKFHKKSVVLAASDGFRLSVCTAPLFEDVADLVSVIIPARALDEVVKICGKHQEEPVQICITPTKSQVLFHMTDVELVSQLIDGNFPDYTQIIPKGHKTHITIGKGELLKACKASNVFARESANIIKFTVTPGTDLTPGNLQLAATSAETGDNLGQLDVLVNGDPIEIAFNGKYIDQFLGSLDGSAQVWLETTNAVSPGRWGAVGEDDFTHVVMPMHLGNR